MIQLIFKIFIFLLAGLEIFINVFNFILQFFEIKRVKKIKASLLQVVLISAIVTLLVLIAQRTLDKTIITGPPETTGLAETTESVETENSPTESRLIFRGYSAEKLEKYGRLTENSPSVEFEFCPSYSGVHRIELSEFEGEIAITVENSSGVQIISEQMRNGEGVILNLADEIYKICLKKMCEDTGFKMVIWKKKPAFSVREYDQIDDMIEYEGQENDYDFWAPRTGRYGFTLMGECDKIELHVYDENWEELKPLEDCLQTGALMYDFKKNQSYYLRVSASQKNIVYSIEIKLVQNFTGKVDIDGEITEQGEEITYSYTPLYSDSFFLGFSTEAEEMSVDFAVLHGNEIIESRDNISKAKFIYVYMQKGETYDIKIIQHSGVGKYSFEVTSWNDSETTTMVAPDHHVVGYFYYVGQERTFTCKSNLSGTYSVEFYEIDEGMILDVEIESPSKQNQIVRQVEAPQGSVKLDMVAGEAYYVHVKQKQNFGEYIMRLMPE